MPEISWPLGTEPTLLHEENLACRSSLFYPLRDLRKSPAARPPPGFFRISSDVLAGGKIELRTGSDARRPARRHRLEAGVETHPFHSVDMVIAEKRALPAAEGMIGHGHRDRHVDTDH